jgi:pimeloyl-ACP methyl ester carboxylesterase
MMRARSTARLQRVALTLGVATLAPLGLIGVLASGPATGATTPTPTASAAAGDAAGIVYPVSSFLDWAQNPADNFTDPSLGEYALQQELSEAQAAVLTQFPGELTGLTGPNGSADAEAFSEQMAAQLVHLRPQVAGDDVTDQANPDFMPDYDHNGVYGDPGDFTAMEANNDGTGSFLYPCLSDTGAVTYETTTGSCAASGTPGDTYLEGLAERQTIVDSRGLALSATLWLPAGAVHPTPHTRHRFPAVVISDGVASAQDSYFWLAMSLAKAGDIVLTYDPAGQGGSVGSAVNLFSPSVPNCEFGGACRDLQDAVRWLVGDPITPVVDLSSTNPLVPESGSGSSGAPAADIENPAYAPTGANVVDPVLNEINQSKLAVAGHSMGALSLLNYLWYQGTGGKGTDGNPLPPLAAGVALSGAGTTTAVEPVQFQTSDYDGSPTLIGPAVGGVDLGEDGSGIGYAEMKPLYDQLRTSGPGQSALSMIVLAGGVHTDFIDTPFITRTPWSLAVSAHYATSWLGCYLDNSEPSCLSAVGAIPDLSTSFASEVAPDNGPLPHVSRCITVPTTASLNDSPSQLLDAEEGHPVYTCQP